MPTQIKTIADLQPDKLNANKGSVRGSGMLEKSLRNYGAGRSILVDRDGSVIAGNKTLEGAAAIGIDDVIVVQSDGTKLVVVQRTDLDINDPKARQLAIADNRVGQVSLEWDSAVLNELLADGVDLSSMFFDNELAFLTGNIELPDDPRELWDGMPDMGTEANAHRQLTVYFKTAEDVEHFAALLDQTVTDNTKSLWYPAQK